MKDKDRQISKKFQYASPAQLHYAKIVSAGVKIGFICLVTTFTLYMLKIPAPEIPTSEMIEHLSKPAEEYSQAADIPQKWGWVKLLPASDFLNYIGIIILTGLTIVALLTLLPSYFRERNLLYAGIVILELVILITAASGILNAGH